MPDHPNLLFITMDELHLEALSCHGAASHRTPHMDRLARQSLWFRHARAASPICLPSRVSLATGLFPHRSRSLSNITGRSMDRRLPSLFSELGRHGYRRMVAGKCHFVPIPYGDIRRDLTREFHHFRDYYASLGMDRLYLQDGNAGSAWYYDDYARDLDQAGLLAEYRRLVGGVAASQCIFDFPGPESMHPDCRVADRAAEMIDEPADGPVFLWVSFSGPHYPNNVPRGCLSAVDMDRALPRRVRDGEWDDPDKLHGMGYRGPGVTEGSDYAPGRAQKNFPEEYWRRWRQAYFANVALLDAQVGKLLDRADRAWGGHYACVLTADHGDMAGNHSLWAKNYSMYEDVLRVPLMIRAPGRREGAVRDAPVSLVDVFPTCLEMLGLPPVPCDGASLLAGGPPREALASEMEGIVSLLRGNLKLTFSRVPMADRTFTELYDLESDPHEFENLARRPGHTGQLRDMSALLDGYRRQHGLEDTVFWAPGRRPYWYD